MAKNPNGWFPEQKLTIKEAIEAYTIGFGLRRISGNEKGSISAGKLADMVLLNDDAQYRSRERSAKSRSQTWVGGKLTYDAGAPTR